MKEIENYDEINKYDFYKKYYLHYAIGTKFEDYIKITKDEYYELRQKLNNSKKAMVEVFITYAVGFYKEEGTYIIKNVDKDVFYCLYDSQRYEKNKRKHEKERHLDTYFEQENINNIKDSYSIEDIILNKHDEERIEKFLKEILSEKQKSRFYKNKLKKIPLVVIAVEEGTTPDAIRDSVNKAKKQIKKNLKNL